jgi:HK97 family phage prohead protease
MTRVIERRFTTGISFRQADDNHGPRISGWAARFNVLSHDLGGFRERIRPGTFFNSLQSDRDCMCLVNHDPNLILGRKKNGTLSLMEDQFGLRMACNLPDTSTGRDINTLVKRGDLSEMSFAFSVDSEGEEWDDELDDQGERCKVRTLTRVALHDVSVVASPAYPATSVNVSADPMTMDALSAAAPRNLFPQGLPAELRARGLGNFNPDAQQRRRRLTNLFL